MKAVYVQGSIWIIDGRKGQDEAYSDWDAANYNHNSKWRACTLLGERLLRAEEDHGNAHGQKTKVPFLQRRAGGNDGGCENGLQRDRDLVTNEHAWSGRAQPEATGAADPRRACGGDRD